MIASFRQARLSGLLGFILSLGPVLNVCAADGPGQLDLNPFQELLRDIVLQEIKQEYVDDNDWGHTAPMTRWSLKGKWFEARWEPRTVQVKHGLWQRMIISLVEPEKNLSIQIIPERAESGRSVFLLLVAAKIKGEARVERWRMGVKMLNASAEFDAAIEARIRCELAIQLKSGSLLDDVTLDPRVTSVDLRLADFNLDRLGILGRDIARELSNPLEPFIADRLDRREAKIVEKANTAIAKRRDRLTFSAGKYVSSGWSKITEAITGEAGDAPPK